MLYATIDCSFTLSQYTPCSPPYSSRICTVSPTTKLKPFSTFVLQLQIAKYKKKTTKLWLSLINKRPKGQIAHLKSSCYQCPISSLYTVQSYHYTNTSVIQEAHWSRRAAECKLQSTHSNGKWLAPCVAYILAYKYVSPISW